VVHSAEGGEKGEEDEGQVGIRLESTHKSVNPIDCMDHTVVDPPFDSIHYGPMLQISVENSFMV
jgi:hypothetical protein